MLNACDSFYNVELQGMSMPDERHFHYKEVNQKWRLWFHCAIGCGGEQESEGVFVFSSNSEIQAYIGILIYMGLADLPEIDDYFQGDLYVCPIVRQTMTLKCSLAFET
jgi:hypothetical protein